MRTGTRWGVTVEAWVLLVAWILGVVGGAGGGLAAAMMADRSSEEERSGRGHGGAGGECQGHGGHQVSGQQPHQGPVRWTTPDGRTRTGRVSVAPHTSAGTQVSVWTNAQGDLVSRPLDRSEAAVHAGLRGMETTAGVGGLVWAVARAVRFFLDRRRMAQWALEWERADMRRGGKTG
ncbi:Rv1733c family protein [Streptomyces sp. NPDC004393]